MDKYKATRITIKVEEVVIEAETQKKAEDIAQCEDQSDLKWKDKTEEDALEEISYQMEKL